jgi:hypothetical protein
MGSLANPYGFQAMAWVYIDAAMQQYAVLRPGGDGSSTYVVHFGHTTNGPSIQGVFSLSFRVVWSVYGQSSRPVWLPGHGMGVY